MSKTHLNVTVDLEVYLTARNIKGINISEVCNNALKIYLEINEKSKDEAELIKIQNDLVNKQKEISSNLLAVKMSLNKFESIRKEAEEKRQKEHDKMQLIQHNTQQTMMRDLV